MPNAKLKLQALTLVDPGGDPAAPGLHGQTSSGGYIESNGIGVSTQNAGWRAALIGAGGAT